MINKKEVIWRYILHQALDNKRVDFAQKDIAKEFKFSLSTVFNALEVPRRSGIIKVHGRGFRIIDKEKFLYLWATFRNIKKDILYETHIDRSARDIEGEMPSNVIFGAFSAYAQKYKEVPADYDKVYVYIRKENIDSVKGRFPNQKGYVNLTVLAADPWLELFGNITPDAQTFADLWNLSEWYAKDFLNALHERILS